MARSLSLPGLLLVLAATPAWAAGDAWHALQKAQPADAARLPAPWRDALSRMSDTQLAALRSGEPASAIALDGGGTLADFLAERGVVGVPAALAAAPLGGGAFTLEGTLAPLGGRIPNESLSGGPFRLDPLLAGGGGTSTSAAFRVDATIGQPTVAAVNSAQTTLQPGFWTQNGTPLADALFRNGFE